MLPYSASFDEDVTAITTTVPGAVKISRPYANSPIFKVTGTQLSFGGEIDITTNKGSYVGSYVIVQPVSASPDNLVFASVGQTLSFTASTPANTAFSESVLDPNVASVSLASTTQGATSTATYNVTALSVGQTEISVEGAQNYTAIIGVIVGPALTTTPSSLSFTALGQQKTFSINPPPNQGTWNQSAASSNTSIVKVAYSAQAWIASAQAWTAMAVAPGKATIYVRNNDGYTGVGQMISIPVDVTATGGVIH